MIKVEWEELPNTWTPFKCSLTTYIAAEIWSCRRDAEKAVPLKDFDRIREALPKEVFLSDRAVCGIHQTTIERGFK